MSSITLWINRRDSLVMLVLFAITAGVGLGRFVDPYSYWTVAICLLLYSLVVKKERLLLALGLTLLGLNLGLARGVEFKQNVNDYQDYYDQKVEVVGKILDDPSIDEGVRDQFYLGDVKLDGKYLPGKLRISGFGGDGLRRGDMISVSGKLREGFASYQGRISYGQITAVSRQKSLIENLRQKFFAAVNSVVVEPGSSLGIGFVVGLRALLPDSLLDSLTITGLTHIVAVSGYNLTVIIRLIRRLVARRSRFLAAALSVCFVVFFLMITGLVPSVFRAAIIAGVSLSAWYYGRHVNPLTMLAVGSSITVLYSPIFIWSDLGWWLSFLAFFGVLVIAPTIVQRFRKGDKQPNLLLQVLIETTSAQLMTAPLIIWTFGRFSLIAILANALVTPLIPLAMLMVTVAGFSYMAWPSIAGWLAVPANFLLGAMVEMVEVLAKPMWASIELSITTAEMLIMYLFLLLLVVRLRRGQPRLEGSYLVE